MSNLEFNINNIHNISKEEEKLRKENLQAFKKIGFPSKKLEDWKFTDLNQIIEKNFNNLDSNYSIKDNNVKKIKDFKHNSITLINGIMKANNFEYENKNKIKINKYEEKISKKEETFNPLINLNNALYDGGYCLEVASNYKLSKPLIIYNYFSNNLDNKVVNNKNSITLGDNSDLEIIEMSSDIAKGNFIQNNYTSVNIGENSSLKNYILQSCKSNGFFFKSLKGSLSNRSNFEELILSSGLKFNRIDEDIDILGEGASCSIQSALFLNKDSHQEIKTKINHLKPNSKSYQKIKNVLNDNCKGIYQGKIYVKDIAQKTNAYQLSRALLLKDTSEFNAKPELEIYADDVKCSHGSTSGSVNEDSIYYLMTRGISRKKSIELLTKAFLFEVVNSIKDIDIKKLVEKNLDRQIYGL